jgi:hypothetical protein
MIANSPKHGPENEPTGAGLSRVGKHFDGQRFEQGFPRMSEPTKDEILERAKELCRADDKLWSEDDFRNPLAVQTSLIPIIDDAERAEYLNRAAEQLRREAAR